MTAATAAAALGRRAGLRVDDARLLRRLDDLGRIGATPGGGVTRPAFSAADRAAVRYVAAEARTAGLDAAVDPAGNLIIHRPRRDRGRPSVVLGSHLDTVIDGGRLDGAYGVVAALEVLQRVHETGLETRHELVAVGFANEEGALYPQPFWGSMAMAGQSLLPDDPRDVAGRSLREPLRELGGCLERVADAAWPPGSVEAYLELHIEQGPVLEGLGLPIGVVSGIVGRIAFDVRVDGSAGHAGTTPMPGRRDAAVAAAQIVLAVERIAGPGGLCRVATAGRLILRPNATNVVPGSASITVEIRDDCADRLDRAAEALRAELAAVAARSGCAVHATETLRTRPVATDARLRSIVADCAEQLLLDHTSLPSGAGHDAQIMAALAPMAMVFVPSRGGLSHVPEEFTEPADLVAGADVLLRAALSV